MFRFNKKVHITNVPFKKKPLVRINVPLLKKVHVTNVPFQKKQLVRINAP